MRFHEHRSTRYRCNRVWLFAWFVIRGEYQKMKQYHRKQNVIRWEWLALGMAIAIVIASAIAFPDADTRQNREIQKLNQRLTEIERKIGR